MDFSTNLKVFIKCWCYIASVLTNTEWPIFFIVSVKTAAVVVLFCKVTTSQWRVPVSELIINTMSRFVY